MKKKHVKILIILGAILVGCCYPVYIFYHPRIGSRSGRVIDAVTGEPIPGAVVSYSWDFSGVLALGETGARHHEATTDQNGEYFIPTQRVRKRSVFDGSLMPASVLIYKDGYAVYKLFRQYRKPTVGRSFGYPDEDQIYREKDNIVKLYPWKEGESHESHCDSIHSWLYDHSGKLLGRELEKERKRAREEALSKDKGE